LGGTFTHVPTAVSWGPDHTALFAVGLEGALYHAQWSSRFGWYPFKNLGGQWTGTPKAVSDQSGNIDVFGLGGQCTINHISYSYSSWSPVRSMEGLWHSTPEVISWGPGRIDVFAIGFDSATYHIFWNGSWSKWERLGGSAVKPPKAISSMEGKISVFHIGRDGGLYHRRIGADGRWGADWEALGGIFFSQPG
jgi:hypothetical protein